MTITLLILVLSALLFVIGRFRSDLIAVCTLLSLVLSGILSPEEALSGFSNPIVIMMAGLFVVGGGIFTTGLAQRVGGGILQLAGSGETRLLVWLMLATSFVGAFVSNTGTVALMMPIVVSMARGAGVSPARFLMPLAFAGSLGGMLTLIGTPPNLIVRDTLAAAGYDAPTFFTFTPIGIVCVGMGIACLIPLSRRFLMGKDKEDTRRKQQKTLEELAEEYRLTKGLRRLRVVSDSPACGQTVRQLAIRSRYGVNVIEVRRTHAPGGNSLIRQVTQYALTDEPLQPGDVLFVTGGEEGVALLAGELRLQKLRGTGAAKRLAFYDVGMAEVLLLPNSSIVGRRVADTNLRNHYGINILGVRRHEDYLVEGLPEVKLHAGDVLLVQGPWDNLARLAESPNGWDVDGWVVMGVPQAQAARVTLDYKAPVAALIMLAMVAGMAFDWVPIDPVTAVMLAGVAMVMTGCVRGVEGAYKSINWESIILFAAMLPMSTALEKTGASAYISEGLVGIVGDSGPHVLLAAIYLATSLLTFFISNTVTAVLMAPITLASAQAQGVSAVPMLMAVTVAASACFASPFSTPPNALVMSAGGYQAIDYIKVGLPLQIIIGIVMVMVLPLLFPFG